MRPNSHNESDLDFKSSGVIGCVHVLPLPGSPSYRGSIEEIIDHALKEVTLYNRFGVQGLIIENTHDVPYTRGCANPETVASMASVCAEARKETELPLGVQILAGAAIESLAVAVACRLQFLRVEGYAFAHIADEGIIQSCAAVLLRKRSELKANHIKVLVDIKKKHSSHAITADVSIGKVAKTCEFMKADGLIITGDFTGEIPDIRDVEDTKRNTQLPVMIGSGVTADNFNRFRNIADAFIIGSYFKADGLWMNDIDERRLETFFEAIR